MTVRAIRGAITVDNNDSGEIIEETKKLLKEVTKINKINADDIISVIFSVTKDLNAAFPAVAARQMGWANIALLCTNEIDVPGSLEKCIRIMMHINSNKNNDEIKHVYMNSAKKLRPDLKD